MCELATMATVLSIASSAATVYQQQQQVEYQNDLNQRQYDNTMKAYVANNAQINLRQQQEREGAIQKKTENDMMARDAIAKNKVAAGESGASGLSVGYLLDSLAGKANRYDSSVDTNYGYAVSALENDRINNTTRAASEINSLKTPAMPDYLSAGLKITNAIGRYTNPNWKGV